MTSFLIKYSSINSILKYLQKAHESNLQLLLKNYKIPQHVLILQVKKYYMKNKKYSPYFGDVSYTLHIPEMYFRMYLIYT